jgi:hypothetical protein
MSENSTTHPEPEFVAFVGIDWADQKHAWCWQRAGATRREHGEVEHTPEMVEAWLSQLAERFGPGPIAVAVEQVKGALVYMLSKYECNTSVSRAFHHVRQHAEVAVSVRVQGRSTGR